MKILKGHMEREQFIRFLGEYLLSSPKPDGNMPPENPLNYVDDVENKNGVVYTKFGAKTETVWHLAGEKTEGRKIIKGLIEGRSFEWEIETGGNHG